MLNDRFCLIAGATTDTMGVAWTAPSPDAVSFVHVDGRLEIEAFAPGRAERAIDVPWRRDATGPPGPCRVVEIHDFAPGDVPGEIPPAIAVPPEAFTLPVLHFSAVPGALRYRIHHRPEDGAESLLAEIQPADPEAGWFNFLLTEALDGRALVGKWHFFRVESLSRYGVESRRWSWAWRAADIPFAPAVAVAAGSAPGLYVFSVGCFPEKKERPWPPRVRTNWACISRRRISPRTA